MIADVVLRAGKVEQGKSRAVFGANATLPFKAVLRSGLAAWCVARVLPGTAAPRGVARKFFNLCKSYNRAEPRATPALC
jgi:hypothetical protein